MKCELANSFLTSLLKILFYRFEVYNAVCYNANSGFWIIAVTQFTTVLMACIILSFRAVFFDIEIDEVENVVGNKAGKEHEIKEVV